MSKKCIVLQKNPQFGNNVSHSRRRTRRKWQVNMQNVTLETGSGLKLGMRISARALRTIEFKGGIEGYLSSTRNGKLSPEMRALKKILKSMSLSETLDLAAGEDSSI